MPKVRLDPTNLHKWPAPPKGHPPMQYTDENTKDSPPGLSLRVTAGGSRTWTFAYRIGDKQRRLTLGDVSRGGYRDPGNTLANARRWAAEVRAEVRLARLGRGPDPAEAKITAKGAPKGETFTELAQAFLAQRKRSLATSTATEYGRQIRAYIKDSDLGRKTAREVTRGDVKAFLAEIAEETPVMANRVFQFVRAVCRWAVREEEPARLDANPADVKRPGGKETTRERVLADHEVAALWLCVEATRPPKIAAPKKGPPFKVTDRRLVAAYVRCLLLIGTRSTETLKMRWANLDLKKKTWTIPGKFRKGERMVVMPLSPRVVSILESLEPITGKDAAVFHGVTDHNVERDWWDDARDRTLAIAARIGRKPEDSFSRHDLRRTCATGQKAPPDIKSRNLGHAVIEGTVPVSGTYNRDAYLDERRAALDAWADHVDAAVAEACVKLDARGNRARRR